MVEPGFRAPDNGVILETERLTEALGETCRLVLCSGPDATTCWTDRQEGEAGSQLERGLAKRFGSRERRGVQIVEHENLRCCGCSVRRPCGGVQRRRASQARVCSGAFKPRGPGGCSEDRQAAY
ncbi:hypothetical protein NDU88_008236 [Pleurodeles waltl]|uniref:Uncharacterized protein n=1 Tax=Pleurodeles waltl TaxID=8319 RepID=A0AAV7N7Q2_PLEWA|nr:hypothetical protein NDU88_008236 [Pleurodeles waltl]